MLFGKCLPSLCTFNDVPCNWHLLAFALASPYLLVTERVRHSNVSMKINVNVCQGLGLSSARCTFLAGRNRMDHDQCYPSIKCLRVVGAHLLQLSLLVPVYYPSAFFTNQNIVFYEADEPVFHPL